MKNFKSKFEEIEIHVAGVWDCPGCGNENFMRLVRNELTPEQQRELDIENGVIEEWQEDAPDAERVESWQLPGVVTCGKCGAEFGSDPNEQ